MPWSTHAPLTPLDPSTCQRAPTAHGSTKAQACPLTSRREYSSASTEPMPGGPALLAESGLGLSIVDAVVHAHGGQVTCQGSPNGTAFRVTLPLDSSASSELEQRA